MRTPLSAEVLSELVGLMYDAALDPARWPGALERIRIELDFYTAGLSLICVPSGEVSLNVMAGSDPQWAELQTQYGADAIDVWGGMDTINAIPPYEPTVLSHIRAKHLWADNRFFREWGRPQGIHDIMALIFGPVSTVVGSLGFGRHEDFGEIGDLEVDAARLLAPHIRRAVEIGHILDVRSVVSSTFEAAIDALSVAVILVDADMHVVHANASARQLLTGTGPVRMRRGTLRVQPPAIEAALAATVRQATDDETKMGRRGIGVPAAGDGVPQVLHVLPLRHGNLRPGLIPSAVAAIFVTPAIPGRMPAPSDALADLFGLTAAEARVLALISAGLTRDEVAKTLGLSRATVKAHLAHVFAKTGKKRQAELVALSASISLPLIG
jgi:DNA-binding CsgD family transcriptional regulator/PAS domain-containing protein